MGFIKKIFKKHLKSYKSILASMFYKVNIIAYFKQQEFIFFFFWSKENQAFQLVVEIIHQ